ncbi:MAG TPA: cell division/cell wall cluster transcriptional repressor MraZ [Fibrobacteres bacterium]|jgi:MraZ protein|nr:cell division/cell wall cluster transcriptional repressor MraZ [Fibrobacterota bacterium]
MSRFHGRYDYTVDEKGRLNMPAKFRKSLNPEADETFVICRAPGGCLRAYPQDVWDNYEKELASRPQTPETLRHQRLLYSTLSDSTLDGQGRITVTSTQMQLASIDKNVTLVGQNGYIEIWDTEKFNSYIGNAADFDDVFFQSVEAGLRQFGEPRK